MVLNVVTSGIDYGLMSALLDQADGKPVSVLTSLCLIVPTLAMGTRRLRDAGKNPLWMLIVIVPVVNVIILTWFFVQPSKG